MRRVCEYANLRICEFANGFAVAVAVAVVGCGGAEVKEPVELPQAMSDATPFVYPLELWDHEIAGQVMLLLRISDAGVVDSVVVQRTSGYAEFDSAALQGARMMQFTPGKQGERRVAMWTKLPVNFARDTVNMGIGGE